MFKFELVGVNQKILGNDMKLCKGVLYAESVADAIDRAKKIVKRDEYEVLSFEEIKK